jgi:hypothetical protein
MDAFTCDSALKRIVSSESIALPLGQPLADLPLRRAIAGIVLAVLTRPCVRGQRLR